MRTIAPAADVDPALIRHFFGDKDSLFAALVADRTNVFKRLAGSLAGDENSIGLRVTDTYLRMWEEADSRPVVLAIVRSAMTSDHAAEMLLEALGGKIRAKIAERMERIAPAGSHLFGLAVARHIIRQPAVVQMDFDYLVLG